MRNTTLPCKTALRMIRPYLDEELGGRDCDAFENHIRDCADCRRELETSFIMDCAIQYLDEGKIDDFDIKGLLDTRIAEGKKRRFRNRMLSVLLWAGIIIAGIVIVILLLRLLFPADFVRIWNAVNNSLEGLLPRS